MGLFFTLVYVLTAYLAPETVFGGLANYHIEVAIALITLVFSLPSAQDAGLMKIPQTYAIFGLSVCVVMSLIFAGLLGQAPATLMDYLPNAMAFFFVVINCKKTSHIKMLLMVLLFAAFFTVFRAFYALHTGDLESPYILAQGAGDGAPILRIRGLSFLSDPNDLAQFMVSLIPCMFIFWGKGKSFSNFVLVFLPVLGLFFGMYLTHSRGGMVAMMIAAIVAGRRKIGLLPAAITGMALFAGLSAVGWSGGRDVNAAQGADRMEAWSTGLELIRAHPIFGVGYRRFTEYFYITAHNTVIVCAAELGLVGLFFWMLFIFPTVRDAVVGSGDKKRNMEAKLAEEQKHPFHRGPREVAGIVPASKLAYTNATVAVPAGGHAPMRGAGNWKDERSNVSKSISTAAASVARYSLPDPMGEPEELPEAEIQRMSSLMLISLTGFLVCGWFLSRPYTMTLYVNVGIATVIYKMAVDRGIAPPSLEFGRAAKLSAVTAISLVMVVYVIIRIQHFLPR
jgi:O-antigen ligase